MARNKPIIIPTVGIIDSTKKWDKIRDNQKLFNGLGLIVGVPESSAIVKDDDGKTEINLAQIGAIHEWGAPKANIPARSHHRAFVNKNTNNLVELQIRGIKSIQEGKDTPEGILNKIGVWWVGGLKAFIRAMKTPPLKPATIKKKGSSSLLIDTSRYIGAQTYKIVSTKTGKPLKSKKDE